jgi:GNAT superfamily N-acetyltransferase
VRYVVRKATVADTAAIGSLIARSARELNAEEYQPEQIEAALRGALGVDSQLVNDGTYFVAETDGMLAGCGGWSRRRTLFGGDAFSNRDALELDPATDAARIRAFFVHPSYARRGIATAILVRCEAEAAAFGFSRFELMATLPGRKFYRTQGYVAGQPQLHDLGDGRTIEFVPMRKPELSKRV